MKTGSAAAPHTYVVEPRVLDRFPVDLARRIAHELLVGAYAGQPYSTEKTKGVADELRDRLKSLGVPRYKIFVQVTVFESKQQGVRIASRALWNAATDFFVSEKISTDNLWAVATIAAVFTP